MPFFVDVSPSAGPLRMRCTISTPTCPDATEIDPSLPTVLFLHPVFFPSEIWHTQFSDPLLRSSNLVAVDVRHHGDTEGTVPKGFGFVQAAEDVSCFMDALDLPPLFVVGLSMGASIASHLAAHHSKQVLGLFLISPLSPYEPEAAGAGRREILDIYKEAKLSGDDELINQAGMGAFQLGFNGTLTPLISQMAKVTVDCGNRRNDTPERLEMVRYIGYDMFVNRTPLSKDKLAQILGPTVIVHASADVAYPEELIRENERDLLDAGCEVDFVSIEGAPHFANVTHAAQINPLLAKFVRERSDLMPHKGHTINQDSPFLARLRSFDVPGGEESDEESDGE